MKITVKNNVHELTGQGKEILMSSDGLDVVCVFVNGNFAPVGLLQRDANGVEYVSELVNGNFRLLVTTINVDEPTLAAA